MVAYQQQHSTFKRLSTHSCTLRVKSHLLKTEKNVFFLAHNISHLWPLNSSHSPFFLNFMLREVKKSKNITLLLCYMGIKATQFIQYQFNNWEGKRLRLIWSCSWFFIPPQQHELYYKWETFYHYMHTLTI